MEVEKTGSNDNHAKPRLTVVAGDPELVAAVEAELPSTAPVPEDKVVNMREYTLRRFARATNQPWPPTQTR
jgi:hypothetical protein